MLVCNLVAGPGSGKTTLAHMIVATLKRRHPGLFVEYVSELAKDLVWEKRFRTVRNRAYMLGRQHEKLAILEQDVDLAVTDSPVVLNAVYGIDDGFPPAFAELCLFYHRLYPSFTVFVHRPHLAAFETKGRMQGPEEAIELDQRLRTLVATQAGGFDAVAAPEFADAERLAAALAERVRAHHDPSARRCGRTELDRIA